METKVRMSHFLNHWVYDWPHVCAQNCMAKSVSMQGRAPVAAPALLYSPTDFLSGNLKALRYDQKWMEIDGIKVMENI